MDENHDKGNSSVECKDNEMQLQNGKKKARLINDQIRKRFLGGYRDHLSGTEYHNASANTPFLPLSHVTQGLKYERVTQTVWSEKPKVIDTAVTVYTQTPVRGIHLLEPLQIYIKPGKLAEIQPIDDQVITIQRWWRRWLKRKRILTYLEGVKRRAEEWERELQKIKQEKEELESKLNQPIDSLVTKEDFDHAYYMLEMERKRLLRAAKASYTGHLLKLANLYALLQETETLKKIEHRKNILREKKEMSLRHTVLNGLSNPRAWISKKDGKPIYMETNVEREFSKWKDIYNDLTMVGISSGQRREILNKIYLMLCEHCDEDVNHIKQMITKELDLLAIGVEPKKLEPFRKILEHHLFDYLEMYAFKNRPGLQEFKLLRLEHRVHVCTECKKAKTEDSFHADTKTKELNKCKACLWLENMSGKRTDYAIYRYILKSLRKEEARLRCVTPTVFLMQVEDIFHLINDIWHAHSALSNKSVLQDLRLCRFYNSVDWSPWNCILLTHEEVLTHRLITDPSSVYGECFIKMVKSKHVIAQEDFKFLHNISERHSQTLEWLNIKKSKPYKYYRVKCPKLTYITQPVNVKIEPSKCKKIEGKCSSLLTS